MERTSFRPTRKYARQLDSQDELAAFRDAFVIPDPDLIYVDGNSLGRLPRPTATHLHSVVADQWGELVIRAWRGAGWMQAPYRLGDKIGQLLGAAPGQIVVTDSTSVNLFKLTIAALALRPERTRIVTDEFNFPTDVYIFQSAGRMLGGRHSVHVLKSGDGVTISLRQVQDALDASTALVSFSHPAFKSCFAYDVPTVTEQVHKAGGLVLWDLSHAVGVLPIQLDAWGVDLAVGCSYKYVNGGPGAPAWLYVRQELQDEAVSPLWGWWSHASPFTFDLDYEPADGIQRFLCGTPPMLSMSALEPALDLLLEAGLPRVRAKSIKLTSFLIELADALLAPLGFWIGTPREPERRGGHVLVCHKEAYRINSALVGEMKMITDFRPPNGIRVGLSPLYNTFEETWEAVDRLRRVVQEDLHQQYPLERQAVN